MTLSRESILGAKDLKTEEVFVEEWGDSVFIQELGTKDRVDLADFIFDNKTKPKEEQKSTLYILVRMLVDSIVNEPGGSKLFTYGDIELLMNKADRALAKLLPVASRVSGYDKILNLEAKNTLKNAL